jgi:hypothetical protein
MTTPELDMPGILELIAETSTRPRYAFMVLNLIATAAGAKGRAGPWVREAGAELTLREWLCDALVPMGQRNPRRIRLAESIREELEREHRLPPDGAEARRLIEDEVRERMRSSGKTNVSRAVSDLVRAGLLRRHYQGYAVDHHNRGGQRHAVYIVAPRAMNALLSRTSPGLAA